MNIKIFQEKITPPPKINKLKRQTKQEKTKTQHTHTHKILIIKKFDEILLFYTFYKDQILIYQAYNVTIIMK